MRLDAFIRQHLDAIVAGWETCAREMLSVPASAASIAELGHYGRALLAEIARDMQRPSGNTHSNPLSQQSATVLVTEDMALGYSAAKYGAVYSAEQVVHELCLLRSVVSSLWCQAESRGEASEAIDGLDRFNAALDGILSRCVQRILSQAAATREMFLAILGHDLRSPLHGIAMASSVLAAPGLAESARVETAKRLLRATKIMEGLVADLLDFTRTRLGAGIPIERSECNMQKACQEALEIVRLSAPEREFTQTFQGDLFADADCSRIRQVLSNVLNNAVQHGDDSTPISLNAMGSEGAITLEISNFGKPIPGDMTTMIFEPLVQVPITTSDPSRRLKDRLGLGLFIAREIVRAHGGTISVKSSLAEGTTFKIQLPRTVPA